MSSAIFFMSVMGLTVCALVSVLGAVVMAGAKENPVGKLVSFLPAVVLVGMIVAWTVIGHGFVAHWRDTAVNVPDGHYTQLYSVPATGGDGWKVYIAMRKDADGKDVLPAEMFTTKEKVAWKFCVYNHRAYDCPSG